MESSNVLLESNMVKAYGDVVFIEPHAQYPVVLLPEGGSEITNMWHEYVAGDPQTIRRIELYGRCCYKSEDRITPDSAARFIKMIVERGHHSVLEHICLTVKYVGSRAMSHQLVRHRIAAYSQESQRYCNYGKADKLYAIMPPEIAKNTHTETEFVSAIAAAYDHYRNLLSQGVKPEDARHVMPNACKTEVVTTFNVRQWRHVFEHRGLNPHAQWEIRGITAAILKEFARVYPQLFADLAAKL